MVDKLDIVLDEVRAMRGEVGCVREDTREIRNLTMNNTIRIVKLEEGDKPRSKLYKVLGGAFVAMGVGMYFLLSH